MRTAITILSLLLAVGCATVGREVTKDQLTSFEKGRTTIPEVQDKLGPPTTTTLMQDGRTAMIYTFAHAQARPETFIPFVGAFVGGSDVRATSVNFTFDASGKLEGYTHTTSVTGSGMGLAGGRYQPPNRDLPQESTSVQ